MNARTTAAILAAAIALLGVLVLTISVTDETGPDGTRHRSLTVTLGGPGHEKVSLPPAAQQIAQSQERQDRAGAEEAAHADLHEPRPPAEQTLDKAEKLKPEGQPTVPESLTLATPSLPGCRTLMVRNYSSRKGAPILIAVTHWTASKDTSPSWSGILGNVRWFDQSASSASSNEIIDRGGRCAYVVHEANKAWTQLWYNPVAVSVEVTNNGSERPLVLPGPGFKTLVRLYVGWHDRWKLPLQRGRVKQSCPDGKPVVYRPGFVEHRDLGPCGGGHPDVGGSPVVDQALAAARAIVRARHPKLTKRQRWAQRHTALHHKRGPLTREERVRNRKYHELLK